MKLAAAVHTPEKTKLSLNYSVAQYRQMRDADDRIGVGRLLSQRFNERFFSPALDASVRSGFTQLAIACLVIETLECFYQGKPNSAGNSRKFFNTFLARHDVLSMLAQGRPDWFYYDVRCGILHQAEVVGGWRIWRKGNLVDVESKTINAKLVITELKNAVAVYVEQLLVDDALWQNCCLKLNAVCDNCL